MSKIDVGHSYTIEEIHSQLEIERSDLEQKYLATCEKEIILPISHKDLLYLNF